MESWPRSELGYSKNVGAWYKGNPQHLIKFNFNFEKVSND